MVQFLDPETTEILPFLDPEIVKMDKKILDPEIVEMVRFLDPEIVEKVKGEVLAGSLTIMLDGTEGL